MRKQSTILKMSLVGLFLFASVNLLFGQSTPAGTQVPPDPMEKLGPQNTTVVGTVITNREDLFGAETPALDFTNELRNSILFYKETAGTSVSGLTLVASKLEDKEDRNLPFTSYKWFYMGQDPASINSDVSSAVAFNLGGTAVPAVGLEQTVSSSTSAHKLPVSGLTEGYHVFKVQGIVNPDNADPSQLCDVETETIVIYVLPQLKVAGSLSDPAGSTQYCEADAAGGQTQVKVKADVTFLNAPSITPAVNEFEKRFRWYAVKQKSDGSYTNIDETNKNVLPTSLDGVELLSEGIGNDITEFAPQMDTYGKYKIFLEVEYTVKDRQYSSADSGNARVKDHVIYRDFVMNGANPLEITVTPKPGKPHITIEAVND